MSSFEEALYNLKNSLFEEDCVKQYFYYKNILEKNKDLKLLDEELKLHQKTMCKNKNNEQIYIKEKEQYNTLKNEFENNPVLVNYQNFKEEVFSLLVDIKEFLG